MTITLDMIKAAMAKADELASRPETYVVNVPLAKRLGWLPADFSAELEADGQPPE